jgi:ribose transport system ATP-binding protein
MTVTEPALRMLGIIKSFPGVQALREAELEVLPGEVHVLLGENGAGKSTLMKVLCGQYRADAGRVEFAGEISQPASPLDAERQGLVMIHQELNLVPGLTAGENIFLGHEPIRAGLIESETIRQGSRDLLHQLRCDVDPDTPVSRLSVAEQQLVEIARALRQQIRLLVMDEPTAALSRSEIEALFEAVRSLCRRGVPVIYISHRLREIFAIGDRVTVMRDGHTVGTREVEQTEVSELIQLMVGRTIAEQIPKREVSTGEAVLEVEDLGREGVLSPTTFTVSSGEILGVAGLMGSGRTELARAIFGADPTDSGTVQVTGQDLPGHQPTASIAAGLGFLTEDRKLQGLLLKRSVTENITLTTLDDFARFGVLDLGAEVERAGTMVDKLGIRAASLDQEAVNLSGGNQQKVVLARWLAARCRVLLFDEPTRGIDVGAKAEIYELIGELVEQGVAVVLISSEMPGGGDARRDPAGDLVALGGHPGADSAARPRPGYIHHFRLLERGPAPFLGCRDCGAAAGIDHDRNTRILRRSCCGQAGLGKEAIGVEDLGTRMEWVLEGARGADAIEYPRVAEHPVDASDAFGIRAATGIDDQDLAIVGLAEAQNANNPLIAHRAFAQQIAAPRLCPANSGGA